jgi:hypothetical protein
MKQFLAGIILGSLLTGTLVGATRFYDSNGSVKAPAGSVESFDYFRQRQLFIDVGHMREQADRDRLERATKPCAK